MPIEAAGAAGEAAFLGLGLHTMTFVDAVAAVERAARDDAFSFVVTPNVDHVVRLSREPVGGLFRAAYRSATLRLCDSRILALLARACGERLTVVPGSDLTAHLFAHVLRPTDRIAIIGGSDALAAALRDRFRELNFAHFVPPMTLAHDPAARDAVVRFVEGSRADYVFLAVGAPQSELIAATIASRGAARGVGLCIGASLEFITGAKRRAPALWQRLRLEWLHRLVSEPRRLGRRYLIDGPGIFGIVARWRLTGRGV